MKKLSLAIAIVALAACAAPAPRSGPGISKTSPGLFEPSVYVYVGVVGGRVVAYPESVVVNSRNVKIYWYLDEGTGYKFSPDAIVIDDTRDDFDNCKGTSHGETLDQGLTYRCHDKNQTKGTSDFPRIYKYRIKVTKPGSPPLELDPMVVND